MRLKIRTDVVVIHASCNTVHDEMTDRSKLDWEPYYALSVCCGEMLPDCMRLTLAGLDTLQSRIGDSGSDWLLMINCVYT